MTAAATTPSGCCSKLPRSTVAWWWSSCAATSDRLPRWLRASITREGEYVIAMDGDLQHDPNDIPMFLQKLREGYDIVSGWRKQRIDNFVMRRIPSRIANWLMAKLSGVNLHDFGTTFKAYRREVVQEVPLYGELHRFIPALASAYGATICEIPIRNVEPRAWRVALWHFAHLPRLLRPDHDPLPAEVHVASAAFLRHFRQR